MTNSLPSIELNIPDKLTDRSYRRDFFLAETSAMIAAQLIALRKRRGFNQSEVAALIDTQQPAISRVERSDYRNWSFNTLRRLAEAMDARLRITIQPSEDVLREYSKNRPAFSSEQDALRELLQGSRNRRSALNPEVKPPDKQDGYLAHRLAEEVSPAMSQQQSDRRDTLGEIPKSGGMGSAALQPPKKPFDYPSGLASW
jgi:transcriptional regulator with XRE-family HTH domain